LLWFWHFLITKIRFKIQSYVEGKSEVSFFSYWKFKNTIKITQGMTTLAV